MAEVQGLAEEETVGEVLAAYGAQGIRERAAASGRSPEEEIEAMLPPEGRDQLPAVVARYQAGAAVLDRGFEVIWEDAFRVQPPHREAAAWASMPANGGRIKTISLVPR